MSRTIPYTIESLAVEFNREPEEIKSVMDLLIQLEMMEYTKEGIYIVKNFAKHQNIKIKEKNKEVVVKFQEKVEVNKEDIQNESKDEEQDTESKVQEKEQHNIKSENNTNANKVGENLSSKQKANRTESQESKSLQQVSAEPLFIQKHIGKKAEKKKMKNSVISHEEDDDEQICSFTEGEYVLGEGETLIRSLTFCGDEIIENIN